MRKAFLPFAKPAIADDAIKGVEECLRSGWLTTGPKAMEFEQVFREFTGSDYAIAVNSATSGLHTALLSLGISSPDEVITTPMTFVATINAIIMAGAKPVLADIDRKTFNINHEDIERKITSHTKAIIPVHFAGRPCHMGAIEAIAEKHNLYIIEDAAHALGAEYQGRKIGYVDNHRKIAVFSFHPTKNITTGEGGMACLHDEETAERMSIIRQHGMSKGAWNRYAAKGKTHYDVLIPGLKYNMMDIQAAIGISQMKYLPAFNRRRKEIVAEYLRAFQETEGLILPPEVFTGDIHAWHIFTPLIDTNRLSITRDEFMKLMEKENIGTAFHYQAVHLFSYYAKMYGWCKGDYPNAEYVSARILSLPLFPTMTDEDVNDVITTTKKILSQRKR